MPWLGFADNLTPPPATPPPPAPPAPRDDEPESEGDDAASLQDELGGMLNRVLPAAISILLHAAVILIAVFLVWSTVKTPEDEDIIVSTVRLSATPPSPMQQQTQKQQLQRQTTQSQSRQLTQQRSVERSTLTSQVNTQSNLVGMMGAPRMSQSNPFSEALADNAELSVKFFNSGGTNAKKIIYLIDASGSLLDTLPFVIQELKRSINELRPPQKFTVIFFQGDDAIEVPERGLKLATPEMKEAVARWVDPRAGNIVPAGDGNPVPAIRLALRYKPQLLFILSDDITGKGRYEVDQAQLVAEVAAANGAQTKINTIQFLYPDPIAAFGKPTLEIIALDNGGTYNFLDAQELGIR